MDFSTSKKNCVEIWIKQILDFVYSFLDKIQLKNEFLEVKFNYIREEIDIRVEPLVNQVLEMANKLREKVEESEKEALKCKKFFYLSFLLFP